MRRKSISPTKRLNLFKEKRGVCHICGGKVQAGEAWELSHVIPLKLGGGDDETNWDVAHKKCHRDVTANTDIPNIAKAKRREAKHIGIKKAKGRPLPGTRASGIRKRMSGEVERW